MMLEKPPLNKKPSSNEKSQSEVRIKLIKDGLEITSKFGLIVLVLIVILLPNIATEWAGKSPFESILGVKIKEVYLTESTDNSILASKIIEGAIEKLGDESIKDNENVKAVKAELYTANKYLTDSINLQEKISTKILTPQKNIPTQTTTETKMPGFKWGIVFGADKTIFGAEYEIKKAKEIFKNVRLFYRKGWYRSVIVFDNKEKAEEKLPEIRNKLREGSYLVTLSKWCPQVTAETKKENNLEYYECN